MARKTTKAPDRDGPLFLFGRLNIFPLPRADALFEESELGTFSAFSPNGGSEHDCWVYPYFNENLGIRGEMEGYRPFSGTDRLTQSFAKVEFGIFWQ